MVLKWIQQHIQPLVNKLIGRMEFFTPKEKEELIEETQLSFKKGRAINLTIAAVALVLAIGFQLWISILLIIALAIFSYTNSIKREKAIIDSIKRT